MATRDPFAVRAEGHAAGGRDLHRQSEAHLSGLCVPDLQCAITRNRRQAFAIPAISHTVDKPLMPIECQEFLTGRRIPHLHFIRFTWIVVADSVDLAAAT